MVSPHKHHTDKEPRARRRDASRKYDHSEHGHSVRRERVCNRRRIAKKHISRVRLPDLVEDWACGELRKNYEVFEAARTAADGFDEADYIGWLQPPPFDLTAIALTDNRVDHDQFTNWYVSCAIDGCLLRREEQLEASLKDELGRIGKKKMVDRLREEVRALLTHDWVDMLGMGSLYTPGTREHTIFFTAPPTRDDPLRLQDLQRDPQLPYGRVRSIVDSLNDKHWEIRLLGRVVSVVENADERYLMLEALPGNQALLDDFKELVWALGRLQERTSENVKAADSWSRSGRDGLDGGQIYVHITSTTRMITHAWERDEPWLDTPTLLEPALSNTKSIDPIEIGSAVFCVANLLRIDTVRNEQPQVLASPGRWEKNSEMVVFLRRGSAPGGPRIGASEQLPVREDADQP
ncbi:hypothetical protein C8F01DRAFT_1085155 [Mycena amicta]|nr:hypothetical protein C8F01DRAFT_1085155 [Mycena amicta]